MVDIFQAQRQIRQKRQPPRLRAGSVNSPEQAAHAHLLAHIRAKAVARSNMRSHNRQIRAPCSTSEIDQESAGCKNLT
jgi:hypothetical protein